MNHDELDDAQLRAAARRLGARAAEQLDVERTAAAVLEQLRQQPQAVPSRRIPPWLALAAGIVLVIGGSAVWRAMRHPEAAAPAVAAAGLDLKSLSADQLQDLLKAIDQPFDADSLPATEEPGLDDLSAPELRALLSVLKG